MEYDTNPLPAPARFALIVARCQCSRERRLRAGYIRSVAKHVANPPAGGVFAKAAFAQWLNTLRILPRVASLHQLHVNMAQWMYTVYIGGWLQ
ncbi:unnamed protein product, partial [Iphiclides podalirius]